MKTLTLSLALLTLCPLLLRGESAQEIAKRFDQQKIEALKTYLAQNPEAEDKDQALTFLISSHLSIADFEPVLELLDQRYAALPKGADADLRLLIGEIVRPYIEVGMNSGQRTKAKDFLELVKSDLSSHPEGPQVVQFLNQLSGELSLPGVGDEMEIAFTDLSGTKIDLAKMKDKVVLVDFWATWCGPCIAEMPNVIAAYEKYREQGFEVLGISLDEDKAALEKFIAEKKMNWPQFFDGQGWANELARKHGIQSIPATFLIGKGGKVIAANLRGPALEKAVEEALKQN